MGTVTGRKSDTFDLDSFLPYRLNKAAERMSLTFSAYYRQRYAMTRPEWRVLANLGQHGRLTARQICQLSNQHKTKVSRAVASLEQRGWLSRSQSLQDRREEWLELKRPGLEAYHEIASLGIRHDAELVQRLGGDNARALKKALDALDAIDDDGNL